MKAVILAGGLGVRLRPLTRIIPKPLLPVGESNVLEIQVLGLRRAGVTDIHIATYYRADYVKAFLGDGSRYGVRLHYGTEPKPLGTCGPVTLLEEHLDEPFLLMNGDILTTLDFAEVYEFAGRSEADLTVVTTEIAAPFHFGMVETAGDYLLSVEEKPDFRFEIMAGVYVLRPALFGVIPRDTYFGIDQLIRQQLAAGKAVARFKTSDYWLDIGRVSDYEKVEEAFGEHFHEIGREVAALSS